MRYKELKEKVEAWGEKYNYRPMVEISDCNVKIENFQTTDYGTLAIINKTKKLVIDTNLMIYGVLKDDEKEELFKIIMEFAATDPKDREDEKRFIIPLHGLVTTDGNQQYLTHKDCNFFASRRDKDLRQTWEEKDLKFVPEVYRQFAVEYNEEDDEEV